MVINPITDDVYLPFAFGSGLIFHVGVVVVANTQDLTKEKCLWASFFDFASAEESL